MNGKGKENKGKKKWREVAFEDIVVTAAVVVGVLGGGIMSLFTQFCKPIIIGTFLGMGISSLVYRFLGGINPDNSFAVKGIKLTGTVAVWIISALIINNELAKQIHINPNQEDISQKELILTVRDNNGLLMRGIQLTVADEIIPPQQEDQSKFAIPLKKFIEEDDKIFIRQESEMGEEQKSMNMEYDPKTPKITIFIKNH
ncbi:MAG: hypothetical protein NT166_32635 [Candidatus Aminicenantes bacterium]|nr:hypothetical protein [Candidatus Aminicenantes bacterium]